MKDIQAFSKLGILLVYHIFFANCQRNFSVYVWTHSSPSSEGHAQDHFLGFPFNKYKALICCIIAPCHTQYSGPGNRETGL